jgi:hypothetical protein
MYRLHQSNKMFNEKNDSENVTLAVQNVVKYFLSIGHVFE